MWRTITGWFARLFGGHAQDEVAPPDGSSYEIFKCDHCDKRAVNHVTHVRRAQVEWTSHYCDSCCRQHVWLPAPASAQAATNVPAEDREVAVQVEKVFLSEIHDKQYIVFLDAERNRHLSFCLGLFEALVIDRNLKGMQWPRPMTHHAWLATVKALGATVQSCCVHNREGDTYFAELRLVLGQEMIRVDMRPSDAFAIAMLAGVSVFFMERLLAADAVVGNEPV